jgi:hypothetical protein
VPGSRRGAHVGVPEVRLNPVTAFWAPYVLTRPLSASFADWLGSPTLRYGEVALVGAAPIVAAAVKVRRRQPADPAPGDPVAGHHLVLGGQAE